MMVYKNDKLEYTQLLDLLSKTWNTATDTAMSKACTAKLCDGCTFQQPANNDTKLLHKIADRLGQLLSGVAFSFLFFLNKQAE